MPLICGNSNSEVLISNVKCSDFYQCVDSMSNQTLKNSLFIITLTLENGCLLPNYEFIIFNYFNCELFNNNIEH